MIFPWFGPREGEPAHGFARLSDWELHEATTVPEGGVSLRFNLPETAAWAAWPSFSANYIVTITDTLALELIVTNTSAHQDLTFENCLHTYFAIGDLRAVSIMGLKGVEYLDKVENYAAKTETAEAIKIVSEVDRTYLGTTGPVEILDPKLKVQVEANEAAAAQTQAAPSPGPGQAPEVTNTPPATL